MDFLKELRAAGLISKKLSERVVYGTEEGPAPINPNMPQSDINISGHSTADKPLEQEQPKAEPAPAEPAAKGQKEYLINSAMASMKAVEACLEAMCEGKCWENLSLQPDAATGMSEMLKTMKEWSAKMESWKESAVVVPATTEPPLVQNQTLSQPAAAPQSSAAPAAPVAPAVTTGPVAA
jgi:hypothetical protein